MTNVYFAETIKLGYGNGDQLGNHGCHTPMMEIVSIFQRMDNNVKDD